MISAGLLTQASSYWLRLPVSTISLRWQNEAVVSYYSCGAVADSHRASRY